MTSNNKGIWIQAGYEMFALKGHTEIKVERLAKSVGKSKSSFYHYFADMDLFTEMLLNHHIAQSQIIADKEHQAKNIDPEIITILVEHRLDLLFNRQLRIHQNVKPFAEALCTSNKFIGEAFKTAWAKDLNLQLSEKQLEGVFTLALQNFYLQINEDNLNIKWLSEYFSGLKAITNNFV